MSNLNHDVQALSVHRRSPSMELEEPAAPSANPMTFVNDRLRGRWKWVVLLGFILSGGLAALGYFFAPVRYASNGVVYVEPTPDIILHDIPETAAMTTRAEQYIATQAGLIRGERIASDAVRRLREQNFSEMMELGAVETFLEDLSVGTAKNTYLILVSYEADNPDFAKAAVDAVLKSYETMEDPAQEYEEKRAELDNLKSQKQQQIRSRELAMQQFIDDSEFAHGLLDGFAQLKMSQLATLEMQRDELESRMAMTAGGELSEEEMLALDDPTGERLEEFDPTLGQEREAVRQKQQYLEELRARLGEGHFRVRREADILEALERRLEQRERDAHTAWLASRHITDSGSLEERLTAISADIDVVQADMKTINQERNTLADYSGELEFLRGDLAHIESRIQGLDTEGPAVKRGRVAVRQLGSRPELPTTDRRYQLAAVGGLAGIAFAVAFFLMLGTLDRKAYATAQLQSAKEFDCIGVLPDMTPSLSEDEEARELAAQCVHRVRKRIEILRRPGQGFVIAVTSPSQGDGKTSLALALGWSYAASGHNTILVDCDFIGRALSLHTNRIGYEGVKEAIRSRSLNGEIATVEQSNLSVLGIGRDPTMGPESVRKVDFERLFEHLREKYEIIIVDTGPLLAIVEAPPITVSADGVVLAFRRGRSRRRLEECTKELRATGACYLGVVMNCADQSDCVRYSSLSRVSQDVIDAERSAKAGTATKEQAKRTGKNRLLIALQKPASEKE